MEAPLARRIHLWLTVPPRTVTRDRHALYAVTNYTVVAGALSYLSYVPVHAGFGYFPLVVLNLVVSSAALVSLVLNRRGYVILSMTLLFMLGGLHAVIATLFAGWQSAFHLTLIVGVQLCSLFSFLTTTRRIAFCAALTAIYAGTLYYSSRNPPWYPLPEGVELRLALSNTLLILFISAGIGIYYSLVIERNHQEKEIAFEQLITAKNQAEAASRAKSAFLANMSHELRTPLNAVIGFSDILREEIEDGDIGANSAEDAKKIQEAGQHLLALVNGILDLSKIEAGRMDVTPSKFFTNPLTRQVVSAAESLALANHNALTLQLLDDDVSLETDETKLKQILMNLLSNASKFTDNGQIHVSVRLHHHPKGRGVLFNVEDTGIGIAPALQKQIFAKFAQADESITRRFGGTGLGLAITRRLCELLGGEIWVVSEEGRGSTFSVWVPEKSPPASLAGTDSELE